MTIPLPSESLARAGENFVEKAESFTFGSNYIIKIWQIEFISLCKGKEQVLLSIRHNEPLECGVVPHRVRDTVNIECTCACVNLKLPLNGSKEVDNTYTTHCSEDRSL